MEISDLSFLERRELFLHLHTRLQQQETPQPIYDIDDCVCEISGAEDLWYDRVAYSIALMVSNAMLSYFLKLDLHWDIIISTIRTSLQLSLVGFILVPIFEYSSPWPVFGISLVMIFLASVEARSKPEYRMKEGMFISAFVAIFVSSVATNMFGLFVVIDFDGPFWEPQYFIPTLGLLLGMALQGVSLGINDCTLQLNEYRTTVEIMLSMGASKWEATADVLRRSVRTGIMITLNSMNVIGIVSIPGMMTGQILGGTPPDLAARYQIMIMLMIAFNSMTGLIMAVCMLLWFSFDDTDRLRVEIFYKQSGKRLDLLAGTIVAFFRLFTGDKKKKSPAYSDSSDDEDLKKHQKAEESSCCYSCFSAICCCCVSSPSNDLREPLMRDGAKHDSSFDRRSSDSSSGLSPKKPDRKLPPS